MDGLVTSLVAKHLSGRDLALFAIVNTTTYDYCKHTDINKKLCAGPHSTWHFVPTLLEEARLQHCLGFLDDLAVLSLHKVPLSEYHLSITLQKHCGTKMHIIIGRVLIVNQMVFVANELDVWREYQKGLTEDNYKVFMNHTIQKNMQRLRHKINSIISHKYSKVTVKVVNNVEGDFRRTLIDGLTNIDKLVSCLCEEHQHKIDV